MIRLIIAEKPAMGKIIAGYLGGSKEAEGHIVCPDRIVVTWCVGHIYTLAGADSYNPGFKSWRASDLPLNIPSPLAWVPIPDKKSQVAILKKLLATAQEVIHAGDPDREGQLIVDNVLRELHYCGPVRRIWLNSLDKTCFAKAWASLEVNENRHPLRDAALCRSEADWRFGMNLSRALTLRGRECGYDGVFSYGRVQTPTLALVVKRDREIENFHPKVFYSPFIDVEHAKGVFNAKWQVDKEMDGVDSEGYLVSAAAANELIARVRNKAGVIEQANVKKIINQPPLPPHLSCLQKEAEKFGLTPKQTLDVAQALYEKKVTSYPRTDCRYLPEAQHEDAPKILCALARMGIPGAKDADSKLKAPAWDTKKSSQEPHHAIIPTGETASLSPMEKRVFDIVAQAYVRLFWEAQVLERHEVIFKVEGTLWKAGGDKELIPGWTRIGDKENPEPCRIPTGILKGDPGFARNAVLKEGKTSPPPRFTESSLIGAMESVSRFESDPQLRKILRETSGLGTQATRASILETLKSRNFLAVSGRNITSTPTGRALIDAIPVELSSPTLTALWEDTLNAIARGESRKEEFIRKLLEDMPQLVQKALHANFQKAEGAHLCPKCGKALRKLTSAKGIFWGCVGYPDCAYTTSDVKGRPAVTDKTCPKCGKNLRYRTKANGGYWACPGYPECKYILPEDHGKHERTKSRTGYKGRKPKGTSKSV